jgi:uncharacterized protein YbjT (DUF2867 family)
MTSFYPTPTSANLTRVVTILGGTGFLGRYLVRQLAALGYTVRVVGRHATRASHLKTMGDPGQIVLLSADVTKPESLLPTLQGAYAVVNLVGVLFERGTQQFSALHAQAPEQLAKLARQAGVKHFVHLSALGVDKAVSAKYARTKVTGEKAVRSAFPEAVILRPGIVFGAEDQFFNLFARLSTIIPVLPLIGGGKKRVQPVFAGDVARAIVAAITLPDAMGKTYELGGAETFTWREVMEYIARYTGRKSFLLPLPYEIASTLALLTEWLPRPLITRDQVRLLQQDNVVQDGALGFAQLGILPTHPDDVVPHYLARYAKPNKLAA